MSLYSCVDVIEFKLEEIASLRSAKRFTAKSFTALNDFESKLVTLRSMLCGRIEENNYDNLDIEINFIATFPPEYTEKGGGVDLIIKKLQAMNTNLTLYRAQAQQDMPENDSIFTKHRITKINKNFHKSVEGNCYGFVLSMLDPALSPFEKKIEQLDFNRKIYDYQKNQIDREKDQDTVKRKRLTRKYFCPYADEQAHAILNFANQNLGKHLCLTLKSSMPPAGHACYISKQGDTIRYFDSNFGAYEFPGDQAFLNFYEASLKAYRPDYVFTFYQFSELTPDPDNIKKESKTIAGKIRSFLTGDKYTPRVWLTPALILISGTAGTAVGVGIAFLMGAVLLSNPFSATIIAGIAIALGVTVLASGIAKIFNICAKKGHYGLLAVPHYIQDNLHQRYVSKRSSHDAGLKSSTPAPGPSVVAQNKAEAKSFRRPFFS